jgi:ATP-dependent exoDNAse (exonuclease V) alpha subunit
MRNKLLSMGAFFLFGSPALQDFDTVLDSLNSKSATFTEDDILRKIHKLNIDRENISEISKNVLKKSKHIGENKKGELLYTGKKYQRLESSVLSKFKKLSGKIAKTVCTPEIISNVMKKYQHMSKDQKTAIVRICGKHNIDILIGKAGSGKTVALKAIAEIYKKSGSRVIGASLSAFASENLGKATKIESRSIAYWIHNKWKLSKIENDKSTLFSDEEFGDELTQLKLGDVLIIDEAGMVGASDWKKILNIAEKFELKLIIVGDYNQFKPISAGDCLRLFMSANPNIFELKKILRQKTKWMQKASVEFSKLNIANALKMYHEKAKIHAVDDTISHAAQKYLKQEKYGSIVILCYFKSECAKINNAIRSMKKENGELGEDIVEINGRFFAKNEKIMLLQNDRTFNIKNGQTAIVRSFDKGILSIETETGIKNIDVDEYEQIDYAYAITLHKSQGKSFDNTIVIASKKMNSRAFYVAMTRHIKDVTLYYKKSDFKTLHELVKSASRYDYKDSLEDYVAPE